MPIEFFQQKGQGKISPYPESNIPSVPKKYRFQWTYPIVFLSQPKRMYFQVVHVTEDQGHSFEIISPDLSRNDPKTGETGGPIGSNRSRSIRYDIHPLSHH
jgi:hypothetical protein